MKKTTVCVDPWVERSTSRCTVTLGNTEDNDKILNAFSENKHIPYKLLGISTALECSTAALAAEGKNKKKPPDFKYLEGKAFPI